MVVTRNRLSCELSKNRRNVSHQASSLGMTVRKKHLPSCREKERQARSKRGWWRKVGVVKIAAVIIWEWASGKSCLAWRESRECNAVYLCRSRVLYFLALCNVFVRLKRGGIDALSPAVAKKERSVESSALVALSALATEANETITNCCAYMHPAQRSSITTFKERGCHLVNRISVNWRGKKV